ncbi:MAG: FAD-dependent oxidoreductase [Bacteroidetes bacterium]|nr:MAG: FAD-dependent oxidoreductase [Bacteroidota bacterium]MBL1145146.1 FAD-dependent oxidoreductase [Bacteroidota bacterium]NOG57942.1 FAD-dependent oxidoreductase [Bacteroidota bacterium]
MAKISIEYDVIIVGVGIAGLSLALYLAEANKKHRIVLISKEALDICNTSLAQGGIAAVTDQQKDNFKKHIKDTFKAGLKTGDLAIIKQVINAAPACINDLLNWGVEFDKNGLNFDLHREGGHNQNRILHKSDQTGKEIHQKLLAAISKHQNIEVLEKHTAIDILPQKNKGMLLNCLNEKGLEQFIPAHYIVLATGGSGQIFAHTTNSSIATGDGLAMAARIGAAIQDINYFQFHPTAIYEEGKQQLTLITEALRGFGAHIVNEKGERFLFDYDTSGELANRSVVASAIYAELKKTNKNCVYLRLKHLKAEELSHKFPTVIEQCKKRGINPFKEDIPIIPAAHYQCGGIKVNIDSETTIPNLFAIGECSRTGLHGSNRLASNSLLESVFFAKNAAQRIHQRLTDNANLSQLIELPKTSDSNMLEPLQAEKQISFLKLKSEIQNRLSAVYHLKEMENELEEHEAWLKAQLKKLKVMKQHKSLEFIELKNILEVGLLFIQAKKNQFKVPESIQN